MHSMKHFLILALTTQAVNATEAYAQANITESKNAAAVFVDAASGSDQNSGVIVSPLRTLQAAIKKAAVKSDLSIPTKIVLSPGVYREAVNIPESSSQTSGTLTLESSYIGAATVSGSDVLKSWNRSSNSSIYTHYWGYNLGTCGVPSGWPSNFAPIARHRGMLFVNNTMLTEVLSQSSLRAGTFYVNEGSNVIYMWPPYGTNMSTALVEAAVRSTTLSVVGRKNVVLRGLVLKHAASCINQSGANITKSSHVLIDGVQASWNNWGGLGINYSSYVTVQNSVASHNGGVGFSGYANTNFVMSYNEADYNNWRGAMAALYDWGMGGVKLMKMRTASVRYQHSYRNQAQGLWFDTDNKNITVDHATLSQNVLGSLQLEANEGPITVTNSALCSSGMGANIINTEKLTMKSNLFYNNSGTNRWQAQIFIAGKSGGRQIRDWQTGQSYNLYTSGTVLENNSFQDASAGQNTFGTYLGGYDWYHFSQTLVAGNNRWYDPTTTKPFKLANGKLVTLSGWKSATGTDYSSNWARVTAVSGCGVPSTSFPDFSVNADNRAYSMSHGHTTATLRVNSFNFGTVYLKVTGMPRGVSASLSKSSLSSGVVTLYMSANSSAAYQTVPITIWAWGGSRVHTVTVNVHVAHA